MAGSNPGSTTFCPVTLGRLVNFVPQFPRSVVVKSMDSKDRPIRVQILALLLPCCMSLDKFLNLISILCKTMIIKGLTAWGSSEGSMS